MLPLILALKAFAAGIKDRTNTPCVRDIDSSALGLLSPGAATDGVTLVISLKKSTTFLVIVLKS